MYVMFSLRVASSVQQSICFFSNDVFLCTLVYSFCLISKNIFRSSYLVSVFLGSFVCACLFARLFVCLFACLLACLFVCLFVCVLSSGGWVQLQRSVCCALAPGTLAPEFACLD